MALNLHKVQLLEIFFDENFSITFDFRLWEDFFIFLHYFLHLKVLRMKTEAPALPPRDFYNYSELGIEE